MKQIKLNKNYIMKIKYMAECLEEIIKIVSEPHKYVDLDEENADRYCMICDVISSYNDLIEDKTK